MENTQQGIPRITIRDNWDIGVLEIHIKDYLGDCEIWGDLNISPDEYGLIKTKISSALGKAPTTTTVKALFKRYPILMVTDIINFVLYEFDNNEFWSGWSSRYNIDINLNHRTEIGRMVRDLFTKHDFQVIEDGGYAYVTPILCQAGIPSTCFDKLFDIIDSTLNSTCFIPEEIASELMGYHSYLVDVPVSRYIKLHTERAIELIAQLREMMHAVGDIKTEVQDIPEVPGIQHRIVKRYVQWRAETKKQGRKNNENSQYFFSPKLIYDEVRGISLLIPEQTLRQDSIYKLKWTIIRDNDVDNAKIYYSQVYNSNSKNYTLEAKIPVEPANIYTIQLRDDDRDVQMTKPWTVVGLGSENKVIVFNEHGSALSRNQRFLSRKGTVVVIDSRTTKIKEFHNLYQIALDLPKSWAGFQAFCAYPTEGDALLIIQVLDEVIYLEGNHLFDIELVQNDTLFHEIYNSKEIPVYTRFPTFEVSGYGKNIEQKVFINWQVVMIHRLSNTRRIAFLSELDFQVYDKCMRFSIHDYAQEYFGDMYGAYDLKVYDGKNGRNFSFYLSPAIQSVSKIEDSYNQPSNISFRNRRVSFHVRKNNSISLEFESNSGVNILPSIKGIDWMEISATNKPAYIKGFVVFNYNGSARKFPFKKTIRELEWSFWDERETELTEIGMTKQFYREDFHNTTWRLALHFTDAVDKYKAVRLVLEGANFEELQSKEIKLDDYGNGSATLNLFQDTMVAHLLPQRLMLYISKDYAVEGSICLAIVRSFVQLKNPRYALLKDKPIVYWDPSTKNELLNKRLELTSLNDFDRKPITYSLTDTVRTLTGKEGKKFEGIELKVPLSEGSYYIDAKEDLDFSFFEDEEQAIPFYDSEHVICVNGKQVLEKVFASKSNNLGDWLSAAIIALKKREWIIALSARLRVQIEQVKMVFEAKGCSELLFSLLINSGTMSNLATEDKLELSKLCNLINDFILTNTDRLEILQILLKSKKSDLDCKWIIQELQLYLFCPNGMVVFDKSSVQRMWDINEKMAILINLRGCVRNISVDIDRVINRIGWESLEEMITFTPKSSCDSYNWIECIERCLSGRCKCKYVHFECSKRVWGDGNEYSKLWVADKKGNWSRQTPDLSHTDGYELFGKNYLTLIYELTPEYQTVGIKQYIEHATQEIYKLQNLTVKYTPYFQDFHSVLRNRSADNLGNQKLFYQIGCSSVLHALATRKVINAADLQELLPFWKNAMGAYPELLYRDMILAELTLIFGSGGEINDVYASHRNDRNH
ncbi:hypothetical protein [Desulfosporosinus sp. OT]|uniref:hypothetical protein n=1 Tax=Desulfosporosinus sp. OT TaxID=913865 RepID=UPI000223AE64|nr:hypothetical protein [Desulfosporosinus sp. OT]EGW41759.1 hypothetical protein DOT_0284 [Desulfosporosinus sp. OT]